MTDEQLARVLFAVAEDLDRRGYAMVGVLRQAGHRLLARSFHADGASPDGQSVCARCGRAFRRRGRGRPRKFCEECAPPKTKTREKAMLGAE